MLSDDVETYDAERLDMIRRTIPAQPVTTAETGPVRLDKPAFAYTPGARKTGSDLTLKDALRASPVGMEELHGHAFGSLWSVHYVVGERQWCVTGRFALVPIEETDLELGSLGLDPQKHYHTFDFWAEHYLGSVHGVLHCPAIPLGECQLIGLVAGRDRPAYVADNRHVSMGLHFLTEEVWDGTTLRLGVRGVREREFSCWIAIPEEYEPCGLRGTGVEVRWAEDAGAVRKLRLNFQADEGSVEIEFSETR